MNTKPITNEEILWRDVSRQTSKEQTTDKQSTDFEWTVVGSKLLKLCFHKCDFID